MKKIGTVLVALVLIVLVILSSGCVEETTEGKQITISFIGPFDNNGYPSLFVTIKGDVGNYVLKLVNPMDVTINTMKVTEGEMEDGTHSVWLMASDIHNHNGQSGMYRIIAENENGNYISEKYFHLSKPEFTVYNTTFMYSQALSTYISKITLDIENTGDFLGYFDYIVCKYENGEENMGSADPTLILSGERIAVSATFSSYSAEPLEMGEIYTVTILLYNHYYYNNEEVIYENTIAITVPFF